MSMMDDIGPLLDTQFAWLILPTTAGVNDTPNFTYEDMPEDPDFAVALFAYDGGEPMRTMGTTMYENLRLQIRSRGLTVEEPRDRLYEIWLFLERHNAVVNLVRYAVIEALGSPIELGPDSKNRQLFSQNYRVWRQIR